MSLTPKIYLAGPEVFLPDAMGVGARKKALCRAYGFEGLFPFDHEMPKDDTGTHVDRLIFRANMSLIRSADLGIFNLTPFRSPSADAGTVFELGFLLATGKPAFGYTNEPTQLLDRVKQSDAVSYDAPTMRWRDSLGMAIEDFGNFDNLMIDMALAESFHPILTHAAAFEDRFSDLTAFELCLRDAATAFSIGSTAQSLPD